MRCHDRSWSPGKGGSTGMPQPSSALRYWARRRREGRHLVEEEVQAVVVVEDDRDIRFDLASHRAPAEAVEERLPVRARPAGRGRSYGRSPARGEVVMPPTRAALVKLPSLRPRAGPEFVFRHAGLLGAEVLHRPGRRCRRTWRGSIPLPPAAMSCSTFFGGRIASRCSGFAVPGAVRVPVGLEGASRLAASLNE